ncbi:helix-turn-helix transcriptional regulator [Rhizobium leguminosarum]|uniref:helix-turn-helix transcriptional regulator n=1 Tax=Rhizobium leguminosarum TaxID=384 RepID=UPI0013BE574F|nr:helix-turn-helix domain-containing protein [Rhizobium leguminosarum]NEI66874.1 helix-turn-helix domain-containing protein [Rhizobium leguminosarum]
MTIIANDTEKLLTDKEVAKLLGGVSRATVWGNVKKGIIPKPIKLGGITRFPMSDILGVIETAKQRRAA